MHIDAIGIVDATVDIAQTDNFAVEFIVEQAGGDAAHIAEALHDDRAILRAHTMIAHGLACHDQHTASGRFQASLAAADGKRLASNYGGNGVATVHGVGVHDPGHDLRVG